MLDFFRKTVCEKNWPQKIVGKKMEFSGDLWIAEKSLDFNFQRNRFINAGLAWVWVQKNGFLQLLTFIQSRLHNFSYGFRRILLFYFWSRYISQNRRKSMDESWRPDPKVRVLFASQFVEFPRNWTCILSGTLVCTYLERLMW
jgi:hypothetical protein